MPHTDKFVYFIGMNWREGGVVSDHFRCLADKLVSRGHKVVLIVDRQRYDLIDHENYPFIYTWPSYAPTKFRDMLFFYKLIQRHHPDCLIGVFQSVNVMMVVGWITKIPNRVAWYRTTSKQSVFETNGPTLIKRKYQILRKSLVYRFSTQIITSTQAMKKDLFNVYRVPSSKVDIFTNSISAPDDQYLNLTKDDHRIICVGRLAKLKGQETLLHAIGLIQSHYPKLKVDFYGTGPELKNLERLATELGINKICNFNGSVSHEDVLKNMAASAITVVPSKDEAFGYVNIESMSVGTPVIASGVGGIPEIIRDGIDGYLIPSDNPTILANCIQDLLNNRKLREKMGRNGINRFLEYYDRKKTIDKQVEYFEKKCQ